MHQALHATENALCAVLKLGLQTARILVACCSCMVAMDACVPSYMAAQPEQQHSYRPVPHTSCKHTRRTAQSYKRLPRSRNSVCCKTSTLIYGAGSAPFMHMQRKHNCTGVGPAPTDRSSAPPGRSQQPAGSLPSVQHGMWLLAERMNTTNTGHANPSGCEHPKQPPASRFC